MRISDWSSDVCSSDLLEAKLARIEGDRAASFGPGRADRPTFLTDEEKAVIINGAANWLHIRQRVRIVDGPGPVDPQYGPYRFIGREGVVWRLCSSVFADRCYVFLDPVGAERAEKLVFEIGRASGGAGVCQDV